MGGSEGPSDEAPGLSAPTGVVHDITMPKLGETVTEGTIGSWLKQVGDAVEFDDPLFEVSTDKVDSEIPSPYDGVLLEILVGEGETVPVGTPLARIGEAGAPPPGAGQRQHAADAGSAAAPARPARRPATAAAARRRRRPRSRAGCSRRWSAGWRPRTAWTSHAIAGTGVGGRIRREDVGRCDRRRRADDRAAPAPRRAGGCRRTGTGDPGRGARPAAAGPRDPRDEVVTLSRMRLAVAEGMMASLAQSASVWTSIEVDFDNVEKVRAQAQGPVQEGDRRVTVLPALHLPRRGRRAAGVPDGQLLDRHRRRRP